MLNVTLETSEKTSQSDSSAGRIPLSYFNISYQTVSAFIKSRGALYQVVELMLLQEYNTFLHEKL